MMASYIPNNRSCFLQNSTFNRNIILLHRLRRFSKSMLVNKRGPYYIVRMIHASSDFPHVLKRVLVTTRIWHNECGDRIIMEKIYLFFEEGSWFQGSTKQKRNQRKVKKIANWRKIKLMDKKQSELLPPFQPFSRSDVGSARLDQLLYFAQSRPGFDWIAWLSNYHPAFCLIPIHFDVHINLDNSRQCDNTIENRSLVIFPRSTRVMPLV